MDQSSDRPLAGLRSAPIGSPHKKGGLYAANLRRDFIRHAQHLAIKSLGKGRCIACARELEKKIRVSRSGVKTDSKSIGSA